jgi:hypothetical protein
VRWMRSQRRCRTGMSREAGGDRGWLSRDRAAARHGDRAGGDVASARGKSALGGTAGPGPPRVEAPVKAAASGHPTRLHRRQWRRPERMQCRQQRANGPALPSGRTVTTSPVQRGGTAAGSSRSEHDRRNYDGVTQMSQVTDLLEIRSKRSGVQILSAPQRMSCKCRGFWRFHGGALV